MTEETGKEILTTLELLCFLQARAILPESKTDAEVFDYVNICKRGMARGFR